MYLDLLRIHRTSFSLQALESYIKRAWDIESNQANKGWKEERRAQDVWTRGGWQDVWTSSFF